MEDPLCTLDGRHHCIGIPQVASDVTRADVFAGVCDVKDSDVMTVSYQATGQCRAHHAGTSDDKMSNAASIHTLLLLLCGYHTCQLQAGTGVASPMTIPQAHP